MCAIGGINRIQITDPGSLTACEIIGNNISGLFALHSTVLGVCIEQSAYIGILKSSI